MNSLLSGLLGQQTYSSLTGAGLQNAQNSQGMIGTLAQHAQYAQQQATAYNQALMAGQMAQQQHRYMINGRTMTFEAWLDELAPGEDNSLRSFLILKYRNAK